MELEDKAAQQEQQTEREQLDQVVEIPHLDNTMLSEESEELEPEVLERQFRWQITEALQVELDQQEVQEFRLLYQLHFYLEEQVAEEAEVSLLVGQQQQEVVLEEEAQYSI